MATAGEVGDTSRVLLVAAALLPSGKEANGLPLQKLHLLRSGFFS